MLVWMSVVLHKSIGVRRWIEALFAAMCMLAPGALSAPEGALVHKRTIATYCHVHFGSDERLAPAFVGAARRSQTVVSLLPSATEMVAELLGEEDARARLVGAVGLGLQPLELHPLVGSVLVHGHQQLAAVGGDGRVAQRADDDAAVELPNNPKALDAVAAQADARCRRPLCLC